MKNRYVMMSVSHAHHCIGDYETPLLVSYTAPHAHLSVSVSVDSFNSSILYNVLVSRRRREGVCVCVGGPAGVITTGKSLVIKSFAPL